ncbi:unnamed protein product [Ectocarpus fasciculatus]
MTRRATCQGTETHRKGMPEPANRQSLEQVPVIVASPPKTLARGSMCSGSDRKGSCSGCTSGGTGTTRGDPRAGSIVPLQQLQHQQQQQQQQRAHPFVDSMVQQHIAAVDENEESEEKSFRNGADLHSSSTGDEQREEKRGVGWAPRTTYKLSPIAETGPPASVSLEEDASAGLVDHDHRRVSNMPVLSAGPHFPHKPGSSASSLFRLNKPKRQEGPQRRRPHQQQQHNTGSWTPRKGGRDTGKTSPNSRPRVRKRPSMLGMLQNAQNQAALSRGSPRNSHCPGGGCLVEGKGDEESCAAAGNDLAGHKCTSRRIGLVGIGGGRDASRTNPTPVSTAAVADKDNERLPSTSLPINQTPTVYHEDAPRLVGTIRRLRQNSVRIIQRSPGPKLLIQGE